MATGWSGIDWLQLLWWKAVQQILPHWTTKPINNFVGARRFESLILISGTQRRTVEVFYWSREIICATFQLSTVGSLASENLFGETDVKLSTGFGLFYWMPQHCLTGYMHAPSLVVPRQHCYSICMLYSFWTPVAQTYPKSFCMKKTLQS